MSIFRGMHKKSAQNLLEYTVLVSVISAALLAMGLYIQRSINARIKQAQIELDESKR